MKYLKLFSILLMPALFILSSCEDEKGLTKSDLETSQGYITVNLDGKSKDGEKLNEQFKLTKFGSGNEGWSWSNSIEVSEGFEGKKSYSANIWRYDDVLNTSKTVILDLSFNENDTVSYGTARINFQKEMGDNELLSLELEKNLGNDQFKNFSFDESTYNISGEFSFTRTYTKNNDSLNVNVEFQAQPKKIVD